MYELNSRVSLTLSREKGVIIGRAEYLGAPPSYLIRYVSADGRQVEGWFELSAFNLD